MRKAGKMLLLTTLMSLFMIAMAFAQMGEKGQMTGEMSPDSTRVMMMQMMKNHDMMKKNFTKLEDHMKSMMEIKETAALHSEMEKHLEMMKSMDRMMDKQHKMYQMMMDSEGIGQMEHMKEMQGKTMEKSKSESMEKEKKY